MERLHSRKTARIPPKTTVPPLPSALLLRLRRHRRHELCIAILADDRGETNATPLYDCHAHDHRRIDAETGGHLDVACDEDLVLFDPRLDRLAGGRAVIRSPPGDPHIRRHESHIARAGGEV